MILVKLVIAIDELGTTASLFNSRLATISIPGTPLTQIRVTDTHRRSSTDQATTGQVTTDTTASRPKVMELRRIKAVKLTLTEELAETCSEIERSWAVSR